MNKRARRILIGTAILAATFLILVALISFLLDLDRHKPLIEAAASKALGIEFKIRGKASLHWLPRPRVILRDIHLTLGESDSLAAEELQVWPRWVPFILHRHISVVRLSLLTPTIWFEKRRQGEMSHDTPADEDSVREATASPPGKVGSISVHHGSVVYLDKQSGRSVELSDLDLELSDVSWGERTRRRLPDLLKSLSLHGTLHAQKLQVGKFSASDLGAEVSDEAGLLQLDSTAMTFLGGVSRGRLQLDLRDSLPRIRVVQAATHLELNQLLPVQIFSGTAEAALDIEGTGNGLRAIMSTAQGHIAVRSEHISISSLDIDKLIDDYNKTQNFSLIDLGALVVAGPFAPLLTKGLDFSRLGFFGQMGHGRSAIRKVVSDWQIAKGIATTEDVAFTTEKNTVAFRGSLDLVNRRYQNFFVATVDARGCAKVKQEITGSFPQPHAEGAASRSVLGMFKGVVRGVRKLVQPGRCDPFYSGSAIH